MSIVGRHTCQAMLLVLLIVLFANSVFAATMYRPFFLASKGSDYQGAISATKQKLTTAGFEIVGEYSPYTGATIIIVTNDALKSNAKATEFGGYGVIQRVSVTDVGGEIQVAYTNPTYMAYAYRMQGDLAAITEKLKNTLGYIKDFGSAKGLTAKDLSVYKYMFGMPYFDQPMELMKYDSHSAAVDALEQGLAERTGGVFKVYRVDIPGKDQSLFGVGMTQDLSDDATIMSIIDFKPERSTNHLSYEILVHSNGKIYALDPKFRIAINFPDLEMAGEHSFMGIMACPIAILNCLTLVSGGEVVANDDEYDF